MANKISQPVLKKKLTGIRIDLDNLAADEEYVRNSWTERYTDEERAKLKELSSLAKKLNRIITRL